MPDSANSYKFYDVLGCSKDSSLDEIKRAYKKLALLYHPDKIETGWLKDKFLEIAEAWRVLSDPELKQKYDAECRQADLESESILIHDRIQLGDMDVAEDGEMTFPCRCGSNYSIDKSDIDEGEALVYISCQECTFNIAVDVTSSHDTPNSAE